MLPSPSLHSYTRVILPSRSPHFNLSSPTPSFHFLIIVFPPSITPNFPSLLHHSFLHVFFYSSLLAIFLITLSLPPLLLYLSCSPSRLPSLPSSFISLPFHFSCFWPPSFFHLRSLHPRFLFLLQFHRLPWTLNERIAGGSMFSLLYPLGTKMFYQTKENWVLFV